MSKVTTMHFNGLDVKCIFNPKLKHSYIQIKDKKVTLKTSSTSVSFIQGLLSSKREWIIEKLESTPQKIEYDYFSEVCYLGEVHKIADSSKFNPLKSSIERLKKRENILLLHDTFYKKEAETFLLERLNFFATEMKLSYSMMKLRKMRRRWGSCNSNGVITFNTHLMKHTSDAIDYVVVHELAHLLEMNHSKKFYTLVSKYIPNYKEIEREMRLFSW